MLGDDMTRARRALGAVLVCATVLGGLLVVALPTGAAGTAQARAAATCTTSRVVPGKPVAPASTPPVPEDWVGVVFTESETRTPVDVTVTVDLRHPDLGKLGIHVYAPGGGRTQLFNYGETTGAATGAYQFSDAATAPFVGSNPLPGTYRPRTPMANLAGRSPQGSWMILLLTESPSAGEVRQVTVTYTFADCPQPDADADGLPDPADNCPAIANPDQANSDDDSVGNACDIDDDNDGTDDADDACPTAAATGGCPPGARSVRLRRAGGAKVRGTIRSTVAQCRTDRVLLKRVRPGKDPVAARARSKATGAFVLERPRRPGRYYATVQTRTVAGVARCTAASSKKIAVRR